MTITGMLILVLWMVVIPIGVGAIPAVYVDKKHHHAGFMWTTGTILLWAAFQVICVPFILMQEQNQNFLKVVKLFGTTGIGLSLIGICLWSIQEIKKKKAQSIQAKKRTHRKREYFFWGIALLLIALQLVCSVIMRYADGDDAFYVAVSTLTKQSSTMYQLTPYSMGATGMSNRHGLAPFPIWIAFLAKVSGCSVPIVAHTVVSTVLIAMTYVIYYQIGEILLRKQKEHLPIFLSFTALLVIFGDYSIYTAENFMIARSRQGKAALGNIIVPMVILLFLLIFERMREEKKAEWMLWVLLAAVVTSACLCSTLGTFLMCLFLGVIGLCAGAVYRKWGLIWKTALCCLPALVYVALYFKLG